MRLSSFMRNNLLKNSRYVKEMQEIVGANNRLLAETAGVKKLGNKLLNLKGSPVESLSRPALGFVVFL